MNRLFYASFLCGLILWQYPLILDFVTSIKCRIIIRHNLKEVSTINEKKTYSGLLFHLDRLLIATKANEHINTPWELIYLSCLIGIGSGIVIFFIINLQFAFIGGGLMALLPILYLFLNLKQKRMRSSKEGDIMIQELLSNYKVYDYNMLEALEVTAENLEGAPISKSILIDLVKGLNKTFTREDLQPVLSNFKYSLGTVWGNALASDIYFAQCYGIKVTESLEDLAASIDNSRKIVEHSKQEHNEAKLMLKYLAPISYILSVICACKFFRFTLLKFISYQFTTGLGLKWFIIMIIFYVVGIAVNSLLTSDKMDIA